MENSVSCNKWRPLTARLLPTLTLAMTDAGRYLKFEEPSTVVSPGNMVGKVSPICSLPCCPSSAGIDAGSKYSSGGDPLAGPKSESALGAERHHAAAKALTNTKVRSVLVSFCPWQKTLPHLYNQLPRPRMEKMHPKTLENASSV